MRLDETGRVIGFLEKPQTDREIDMVRMEPAWIDKQGIASGGRDCLASMGIYLFDRDTLVDVLTKTDYQDFGKEIFPTSIRTRLVQVHLFDGYWEDIGTIRSFYEANLSLAGSRPPFELASAAAPVYTRARSLPPTRIDDATITGSLIADGCRIGKNAIIENSVIGLRSVIGEGVIVRDSVIMGADDYEVDQGDAGVRPADAPPLGIGPGSVIQEAIVDKNCRIGRGVRVVNEHRIDHSDDADDCTVREGIPVVVKDAVLADGWKL